LDKISSHWHNRQQLGWSVLRLACLWFEFF